MLHEGLSRFECFCCSLEVFINLCHHDKDLTLVAFCIFCPVWLEVWQTHLFPTNFCTLNTFLCDSHLFLSPRWTETELPKMSKSELSPACSHLSVACGDETTECQQKWREMCSCCCSNRSAALGLSPNIPVSFSGVSTDVWKAFLAAREADGQLVLVKSTATAGFHTARPQASSVWAPMSRCWRAKHTCYIPACFNVAASVLAFAFSPKLSLEWWEQPYVFGHIFVSNDFWCLKYPAIVTGICCQCLFPN